MHTCFQPVELSLPTWSLFDDWTPCATLLTPENIVEVARPLRRPAAFHLALWPPSCSLCLGKGAAEDAGLHMCLPPLVLQLPAVLFCATQLLTLCLGLCSSSPKVPWGWLFPFVLSKCWQGGGFQDAVLWPCSPCLLLGLGPIGFAAAGV